MRLGGLILVVWALTIAVLVPLSARLPNRAPWPDAGFRACELPCWSNITPGQTAFSEVVPLLTNTLPSNARLLVSGSQVDFWTQTGETPFYGYLYYSKGSVGNMSMHVELTIGEMIRRLGAPGCVYLEQVDSGEKLFAVYWESSAGMVGVLIPVSDNRWGPNNQTSTLFLGSPQAACSRDKAAAWLGFAPYARYRQWMSANR